MIIMKIVVMRESLRWLGHNLRKRYENCGKPTGRFEVVKDQG